jgi:predicted DNA-binding antitoxin AbrB/MazE fold protein
MRLRPGEWVEVKTEAEILATLDERGMLEGMPFMPEMRQFCGQRFEVKSRADRTVVEKLAVRRMTGAVHLRELRCDGSAHDNCSRECLLFWKEAWLRPIQEPKAAGGTRLVEALATKEGDRYLCQSTELTRATKHLPAWDLRQFVRAMWAEDTRTVDLLHSMWIFARDMLAWRVFRRPEWEWNVISGPCTSTPVERLDLQPGERVRVKSREEILKTLDKRGWNRGMEFSREMLDHCGKEFTVLRRVDNIIRDQSAKMVRMKDTVLLEGLVYKDLVRLAAPRAEYMYWRECWLERVDDVKAPAQEAV